MEFTLNFQALNDLPFQKYPNDFTFVVNGKKYPTSRIIADILSPKIRKLHFTDESITEFHMECDIKANNENKNDYFEEFLKLCTNTQIKLDSTRQEIYSQYLYKLGNVSEYFRIQTEILSSISTENCINRLLTIENITKSISEDIDRSIINIDKIITFIASHFEDIDKQKLDQLSIEKLTEIIFSDSLKISDEDSLLSFILDLYEKDHSYSILFGGVLFINASETVLKKFVDEIEFSDLNVQTWNSICRRLFQLKNNSSQNNRSRYLQQFVKEFKYSQQENEQEINGIMKYLSSKNPGNIHSNGTIEITTNSILENNKNNHPKYLVGYDSTLCYWSDNKADIFVCFDFKDKKVQLSDYLLKSCEHEEDGSHLKNWVIEASNDGENWDEIDRRTNDSSLNGIDFEAVFHVSIERNEFYRFIRLRQTGYSWDDSFDEPNYYFALCLAEFYGKLEENNSK